MSKFPFLNVFSSSVLVFDSRRCGKGASQPPEGATLIHTHIHIEYYLFLLKIKIRTFLKLYFSSILFLIVISSVCVFRCNCLINQMHWGDMPTIFCWLWRSKWKRKKHKNSRIFKANLKLFILRRNRVSIQFLSFIFLIKATCNLPQIS